MSIWTMALVGLEVVTIGMAAWSGPHALAGSAVFNMVLVGLFAPILIDFRTGVDFAPMVSNFGNIPYAGVIAAQMLVAEDQGWKFARRTTRMVLQWMVMLLLFVVTIDNLPDISDNPAKQAVSILAPHSIHIVGASFAAFIAAQCVVITWAMRPRMTGIPTLVQMVMIAGIAQVVDSAVFFWGAFWRTHTLDWITNAAIVGTIIKSALSAFLILFAVILRHLKRL